MKGRSRGGDDSKVDNIGIRSVGFRELAAPGGVRWKKEKPALTEYRKWGIFHPSIGVTLPGMRALFVFCPFLLCCSAWAQSYQPVTPILSGYITRVASASDFDVDGTHVLCGPNTSIKAPSGDVYYAGCFETPPRLGQPVDVYGHRKKKLHAVAADRIDVKRVRHDDISGYAVIDAVAGGTSAAGELWFRADGYRMVLTPQTAATFSAPLTGIRDVMTNVWVEYEAKARGDGTFVLRSAKFSQNFISDREDAMRAKTEYDPSAVRADAKPNPAAVAIGLGVDPKRIPPWPDRDMQVRIDTIGQKLVPGWQKKLDANDPSRIDFRFQLTDGTRWPWVIALPSGIILVPHEVVEKMQSDSQLAEILADAVASVLEKQTYRMRVASAVTKGGTVASWAGIVPVVGGPITLATIGTGTSAAVVARKEEHQSGRVSLDLLIDAGYDIDEAPVAWWLLATKKPKPLDQIPMPERSAYLYRTLAEFWSSAAGPAAP